MNDVNKEFMDQVVYTATLPPPTRRCGRMLDVTTGKLEKTRPFLSWCLIARNCEKTIEATLKSLRERTPDAEIVIVDTMSSDSTPEISLLYADVFEEYKGPRGDWTREMPAFDDAAAARNYSFSLATGKWIGWIDTDDVLPGPEEAEKLLKANGRWKPGEGKALGDDPAPMALEDALAAVDEKFPECSSIWAPYLYRRHTDGTAAEWQERERFVRNDGSHSWQGKGHEVLVPHSGVDGQIGTFASLLFVHMKEWTNEDASHSVIRHWNALIPGYEAGDRSSRTAFYLENFSRFVCPQRREEFLRVAYENAFTRLDRMRALIRMGEYAAENGFFLDALEEFSAAQAVRPDLPDAFVAGARVFERADDWIRAAEWYERAISMPFSARESLLNPRDLLIGYRVQASDCLRRAALSLLRQGREEDAIRATERRFVLLRAALECEAIGPDRETVTKLLVWAENDLGALRLAAPIRVLHDYLIRNEENEKAADLVKLLPHTLEDHPVALGLREWAKKVDRHLTDPDAYVAFYNNKKESGALFIEDPFEPTNRLVRVQFLFDWIKANAPRARILEIGCFDGPVGIRVLRECPDVTYVAVDAMAEALDKFKERAEKEGLYDRLQLLQGRDLTVVPAGWKFDVIVYYEIVEHVPDPVARIADLGLFLRPGGRLFVSTPWGACDRGRPYNFETRDPRGHVRALTMKELHDLVTEAGFRVLAHTGVNSASFPGQHLRAERSMVTRRPLSFYVNSALWDWNASHVKATGIGASEETIVYLAEEFARDPERLVSVYGPVPESTPNRGEEVNEGVGYWTRQKGARSTGPLIVSRCPLAGRQLDPEGKRDKILWLQDTIYPDLNADTARDYRKIVTLTEWHKEIISQQTGSEEAHRLTVIPNFLLKDQFRLEGAPKREPHHFIYASSPDRGLIRLLKLWPRILECWPDATLDIFYGWEGCMKLGSEDNPGWTQYYRKTRTDYMGLRWQKGVNERGRVNHAILAREFQRASAWLYPTSFTEAGCLTAAKARAAGCIPVTTKFAGLAETADCDETRWVNMPGVGMIEDPTGTPEAFEAYTNLFLEAVEDAVAASEVTRSFMSEEAIATFDLVEGGVLAQWEEILGG